MASHFFSLSALCVFLISCASAPTLREPASTNISAHAENTEFPLDAKMTDLLKLGFDGIKPLILRDRSHFKETSRIELKKKNAVTRTYFEVSSVDKDPGCAKDQERLNLIYQRLIGLPHLNSLIREELNVPIFLMCNFMEVNGWGGDAKIAISRGVLLKAANDDEIAVLVAHEIAHVSLAHDLETYENTVSSAEMNKKQELEADKVGAIISHLAGYHPMSLIDFLGRLENDRGLDLSWHEPTKKRVRSLRRYFEGMTR